MAAPKGNQFWKLSLDPGRKRAFATPQEFIGLATKYFESHEGEKISWTGLCLSVGVSSRQSLERYKRGEHGKDFVDPIKKALMVVENYYEEKEDGAKGIFALKNFGWKDKTEVDVNAKHSLTSKTDDEIDNKIKEKINKLNADG